MSEININPLAVEPQPVKDMKIPSELKSVITDPAEINRLGIDATVKAIAFVTTLARATQMSLQDGKITVIDALNFYEPAKRLVPFLSTIQQIPLEMKDTVTLEEEKAIQQAVLDSGVLPENLESVVVEVIELVFHLKQFIFRNFVHAN